MRMPATAGGVGERNRQLRLQVIEQSAVVHERTADYEPAAEYEDNPLAYSLGECAKLIAAASLVFLVGVMLCGRMLTFFRPPFFHSSV